MKQRQDDMAAAKDQRPGSIERVEDRQRLAGHEGPTDGQRDEESNEDDQAHPADRLPGMKPGDALPAGRMPRE